MWYNTDAHRCVTDVKLIVHPALVYALHNTAAVGLDPARQTSGRKQPINSCQQQSNIDSCYWNALLSKLLQAADPAIFWFAKEKALI